MDSLWGELSLLLAENADGGGGGNGGGGLASLLFPAMIIMVLFYLMVARPQKSKDRQFRSLLENLKKNDRVITIGGIHGVVTNVQREQERVTIRVDDSNGTTLRMNLSAIAKVVTDEDTESAKKDEK